MIQMKSSIQSLIINANGQVVGQRDPRGIGLSQKYDLMGRLTESKVELKGGQEAITTSHFYDSTGNRTVTIDPNGTIYRYRYNIFNSMIQETKDEDGENIVSYFEYGAFSGNDVFGDAGFVPTKKIDLLELLPYLSMTMLTDCVMLTEVNLLIHIQ